MIFSLDLRKRVIAAVDDNMHIDEAAKVFKVSRRVIYEWLELRAATGDLAPKKDYQKGHSHTIKDWDKFKEFAVAHQHCSIPQMVAEWEKDTTVKISKSVMQRALKKIDYTSKKKLLTTPKPIKKSEKIF